MTINPILYDHEITGAHQLIWELYSAGTDAIIIQDMWILEMDLQPIPIFACTQAHNSDIDKIKFLADIGLSRIILAAELSDNCEKIPAKDPGRAHDTIQIQLKKAGDTIFEVSEVGIDFSADYFIPASLLNNLRRTVLQNLDEKRVQNYERKEQVFLPNQVPYPYKDLDFNANISNVLTKNFHIRHGNYSGINAFELMPKGDFSGKTIMTTRYRIKYELVVCPSKQDASKQNIQFKEPLFLHDKQRSYRLEFDCKACLMRVKF